MNILFKNRIGKGNRGFSLVEIIIYIVLLTVLLGGIINSTFLLAKSYRNVKSVRSLENSAMTAMDRMTKEVRDATSINTGSSLLNVNPGALSLQVPDSSGTAHTILFNTSGGKIMMSKDGVSLGQLTFSDSNVSSLVFRSISTSTSEAIKIEMTIQSGTTTGLVSKNFYNTAILRSSY